MMQKPYSSLGWTRIAAKHPVQRIRSFSVVCASSAKRDLSYESFRNERHKLFDEAVITVRGGNGGDGQIVGSGGGKMVRNFKYNPGFNTPKNIWLPHSDPADGGDGGDVLLYCDLAKDSLLEFHEKSLYSAKKGTQGNPEEGTLAPKSMKKFDRYCRKAQSWRIGVPPGTVVKRKGNGKFIGEIIHHDDELVVAHGGKGGQGVVIPSKKTTNTPSKNRRKRNRVETFDVEDRQDWRADSKGQPGEERTLQLLLRVVADIGFVGLPNVGKSSLLRSLTAADPQVAAYPFTTLIPNLGVMGTGGDPILVDLPGLIEGAHVGKGLGKNFLRHLRRTRILLQVMDISQPDPVADYAAIRSELWMYNPQYCTRPHIIALNMIDKMPQASIQVQKVIEGIETSARSLQEKDHESTLPEKIICTSAMDGTGIEQLQSALQEIVGNKIEDEEKQMRETELTPYNINHGFSWK